MTSQSEREYGIPEDVKDALRRRRRLEALWYVGPLEEKPVLRDRHGQSVGRFWWVVPAIAFAVIAGLLILFIVAMATHPEVF